jgi:iron(III) transport system permease protein
MLTRAPCRTGQALARPRHRAAGVLRRRWALVLAMLGMAVFASFASFWPYNLAPSLRHYTMGLVDAEVGVGFVNSLKMAAGTALFGTALVFCGAYLLEKTRMAGACAAPCGCWRCCRWRCPGLVLGLGYIFFFNEPTNPLNGCTTRSRC